MSRMRLLFEEALALPPAQRAGFVHDAAADDPALAAQVLRLVALDARAAIDTMAVGGGLGQRLAPLIEAGSRIGLQVGRYRIVAPLGVGGLGSVWVAQRVDGALEHRVAVKFIRAPQGDPGIAKRLAREKEHLAALKHPYVCAVLDAGVTDGGEPWVATELIEGSPLLDFCDAHRLGIRARLQLFQRVLAAVGHAHGKLIIHCDLKSSNILVTADGLPKLLDFGIAQLSDDRPEPGERQDRARLLSPASAAPEQWRGDALTVATDLYALGVLLFELLCGEPPAPAVGAGPAPDVGPAGAPRPGLRERARRAPEVAARRGTSPRALARALDEDLEHVVGRCLRAEPSERYANVEQLDADLSAVLGLQPIAQRASNRAYRLRRFVRRNAVGVASAGVLLAGLLAGVIILAAQRAEIAAQRNAAIEQRDRAEAALAIIEDAFLAADPAETLGVDTRIRDVLEAAIPPIDARAAHQPSLAASLYGTLAQVHAGLRSDQRAEQLAARARTQAERAFTGEALVPFWTAHALALIELGRFDPALELLERARATTPDLPPQWYIARSRWSSLRSQNDSAVGYARRAVEATAARGPEDRVATAARWQLAESLRATGQYGPALEVFDATMAWQQRADHASSRALLTRLKRLHTLRESDEGAASLQESAALLREVDRRYGAKSTFGAATREIHGQLLIDRGDRRAGLLALNEAVDARMRALGPDHPGTIMSRYNLAVTQWSDPELADANEGHLRAAFEGARARYGADSNRVTLFRTTLAQFLNRRQKWDAALDLLAQPEAEGALAFAAAENRALFLRQIQRAIDGGCRAGGRARACAPAVDLERRLHVPGGGDPPR